ncbi:hypothetical protein G6F46_009734 [Rhizopus delemar]|nr:hypothetical protein G6F55_008387 [Rhizopus delemar]KAG1542379.1 hypothetical protein G6F51_007306 [Rhizopus arrhizus]KAG1492981.1 hypothetical protein G6F54_008910 [Rhizopus delemar]KAG1514211.1 hypothetical protein G6F53_003854 [Rhizopus delemar]KAG1522340.1 hypothetical protein G6F52_005947 [Rhizopus delemar]
MAKVAPPPSLDFGITAEQVAQITEEIIATELAVNDQIASLKPEEQTYENIVVPLARVSNELAGKTQLVSSLSQISPDAAIREASVAAETKVDQFYIEQSMRHDIYTVVQGYIAKTDLSTLDHEDARLLEKIEQSFRRNGLHLPQEKRDELKELRKRLSEVCIEFNKNWARESSTIKFTKDELEGLDNDFLGGLQQTEEDGVTKYILTMKYPVIKLCKNENTRKLYTIAYNSRNPENVVLLEQAIKLRKQAAKLLGFKNHAAFNLDIKMAKTVEAVDIFLNDLVKKLQAPGEKEIERLKQLKKNEKKDRGEEYDGELNSWDTSYYERMLLGTEYAVDQEEIKKYFSLESTIEKMLDIYEKVLGLHFVKVPAEKAVVWHPDVQLYECWDAVEDKGFSGYMYLDLFPRDNKYPHAACFPIQPSYIAQNGERIAPIAAMVANFTKPTADKPSLLKHDEVVTLFHELGHVMHHLCSRTKYARFHGTSVEGDFVEAPSQMLENWCYDPKSLKYLSAHFETGEPISDDIIQRIVKAKNVDAAILNLRQLFFGIYDMTLHTSEEESIDTSKLYNDLRKKITLINAPENTFGQAAFGHLMGGYDAGYYGYLWSKVFSSDMYYSKFEKNTLSPETGYLYRKEILEKGSSRDGMDSLKAFLGREPSSEAFMREDIGACLWGWALDLCILANCNIDSHSILQIQQDEKHSPLYTPIFYFSGILSIITGAWLFIYYYSYTPSTALVPYVLALGLLFWPGESLYKKDRIRFIRLLKRTFLSGIHAPVFFSDIILADMLTSVSNVFGDSFMATCVMLTGQPLSYFMDNTDNIYYKDIIVPFIICLPYLIRLKQCIAEYLDSKEQRHIYNALKYASSIPVIIFSAIQKKANIYILESGQVPNSWYLNEIHVFRFWVIFIFINSMYSFWWDISMDWNLITINTQSHTVHIRRQLYFSQPIYYILAVFIDFLLRITWSFKLSSHLLIRQLDASIFLLELMEVFRRWVWVMFRMENEWVKKVYSSLPSTLRLDRLDRKSASGLLSPIVEEEDLLPILN